VSEVQAARDFKNAVLGSLVRQFNSSSTGAGVGPGRAKVVPPPSLQQRQQHRMQPTGGVMRPGAGGGTKASASTATPGLGVARAPGGLNSRPSGGIGSAGGLTPVRDPSLATLPLCCNWAAPCLASCRLALRLVLLVHMIKCWFNIGCRLITGIQLDVGAGHAAAGSRPTGDGPAGAPGLAGGSLCLWPVAPCGDCLLPSRPLDSR
jgi:hypothetical protein